ncbi:CapA family protein [Lyngbya sp. CCY1209]|uniref:CapA family protein n=1 Tax=Lyngbya sp. CCY1209 TaxID=2886103 RepID=UPI002D2179CA|nr:CapA family protein [Lyngbya sp. CCY1209]MEB3886455.1 CapA family protein [Lyngbya sp. CCY1209]
MVYAQNLSRPTLFDLARAGDFRALGHLIDSYLAPEGIRARVFPDRNGCLQVLVEFRQEPIAERLVKHICHLLWKLNSPRVEGVKIAGRFAGQPQILWNRSVRIVTPATRSRRRTRNLLSPERINFQTLRTLLMVGSAVASFIIGCWVSYYEVMGSQVVAPSPAGRRQASEAVVTAAPPKRTDTVRAALETVPVVKHTALLNPDDPTVTLMFGGDVTLANSFADKVGDDYAWAFAELDEYREADVAMVNLENPLTRSTLIRPNKQFNFKADPQAVQVLTEGGIDLVNLANNHTMDYEEPGLVETLETLQEAGIHAIGAGRDIVEARRPEILEVKGQRIAYFGYYDADFHAATEEQAGTNPRHDERVAADIRAVRDQVDWVVVNYHWGVELAEYPGDWQIDLARYTIDQGADVVVGHHPHVLQGAEIYKGRPIVYSLGNFIFGGNSRNDYDTAILKVSLKQNRKMKVEFLPVEVRDYQAQVVRGNKGEEILRNVERLSRIFDRPMDAAVVLKPRSDGGTAEPVLPDLSAPESSAATSPTEPDDLEPFIKTPFIKEPFISTPQPESSSSSQSYNGFNSAISFDVAIPPRNRTGERQPAGTEIEARFSSATARHVSGIHLPPLAPGF